MKPLPHPLPVMLIMGTILGAPLSAEPTPPAWWFNGEPPVMNEKAESNKSVVTTGQAKWMVSEALRSLATVSPETALLILADLEGTGPDYADRIVDLSVPNPKETEWLEQQKAALTVGQLKALADPFYRRLNTLNADWLVTEKITNGTHHENSIFPWTADTADDANQAVATIGQLKAVFSLRFDTLETIDSDDTDTDGDGIPDEWEMGIVSYSDSDDILDISQVTLTSDFDGDFLRDYDEFILTTDPTNKDTDTDGLLDGNELALEANPLEMDHPAPNLKLL